jgi:hypothetical protein
LYATLTCVSQSYSFFGLLAVRQCFSQCRRFPVSQANSFDGGPQDAFGVSVSMSGDVIVAGTVVNVAYVFVKPAGGWGETAGTHSFLGADLIAL